MNEYEELDDETLVLAWRGGDRRAGAVLVGRHYHRIARFFCARRRSDWEELTQSTFLGCIEGIERFRGEASFGTFIFAIAHKKLLKQLREQSRDQRRAGCVDVEHDLVDTCAWTPEIAGVMHLQVLAALRSLPDDTQLMLRLHYWENQSIRALAARFGVPEGTIKARLHRGRRQILAEFAELAETTGEFEVMRCGLELWADHLARTCGIDEAVNLALDATTLARMEQPHCHEDQKRSSSPPDAHPPGLGRGVRRYRL